MGYDLKERLLFFTKLLVSGFMFLMVPDLRAAPLKELQVTLPMQIGTWSAEPEDRIYDRETIFDYIDGAGEVYRAYNMRTCLSRRYRSSDGPDIVLDIFDMGSSEDAFGVFTHDRDGEALEIGQGALYRPGWLSFWKDRFFVSIYAEEETASSRKAVRGIGKSVASLIKREGDKPRILLNLPEGGLNKRSIRYLHHPVILNYHYYLSDENILKLSPQTDAVLAKYLRDGKYARLLLITYPNQEKAKEGYENFLKHYLPEAEKKEAVKLENGKWCTADLKDGLLTIVLEADSKDISENLLKDVNR